jgi:hypothetical protein
MFDMIKIYYELNEKVRIEILKVLNLGVGSNIRCSHLSSSLSFSQELAYSFFGVTSSNFYSIISNINGNLWFFRAISIFNYSY